MEAIEASTMWLSCNSRLDSNIYFVPKETLLILDKWVVHWILPIELWFDSCYANGNGNGRFLGNKEGINWEKEKLCSFFSFELSCTLFLSSYLFWKRLDLCSQFQQVFLFLLGIDSNQSSTVAISWSQSQSHSPAQTHLISTNATCSCCHLYLLPSIDPSTQTISKCQLPQL